MPRPIRIFIDGECPLCKREGAVILRLDRGRGLVVLEDIAAKTFDPSKWGLTHDAVAKAIHAELPDGRIVSGLEVFRRVYASLGWLGGAVWAPTGWPILRPLFDMGYRWFARNRLRIGGWFGRPACADGSCRVG
jgi:predicted DCC family thiol-disulfide oxidoreductase YuxK